MEEETSRQVSPGKPAGTEQHFIPAANPAQAPRACRHRAGHGFGQGLAQGNGRSWGQGRALTLRAARGLCATHALTIAWHQHPAEPWANAPACSRRSGTCCPATLQPACRRAAGCREDLLRLPGGSAPAASPVAEDALLPVQSDPAVVWKCERRLQWAAWEQLCCRARGTCSPAEGEGSGGLEPAEAAAPGLGRVRGRLAVSLPHWSRWGHCNSSQGAGCSAQPPSTGCGPVQPCTFPARCLCPHTSRASLGIAAAPPTCTAAGMAWTAWPTPALCRSAWCHRAFRAVSLWEDPAQAPGRTEQENL